MAVDSIARQGAELEGTKRVASAGVPVKRPRAASRKEPPIAERTGRGIVNEGSAPLLPMTQVVMEAIEEGLLPPNAAPLFRTLAWIIDQLVNVLQDMPPDRAEVILSEAVEHLGQPPTEEFLLKAGRVGPFNEALMRDEAKMAVSSALWIEKKVRARVPFLTKGPQGVSCGSASTEACADREGPSTAGVREAV